MNGGEKHEPDKTGRIGYRPYWVLLCSVAIRAVHQVGAAVFLSAYLLDFITIPPVFYVVIATISGLLLLATEAMRHRQLFREVAGACTWFKLLLLGAAYHHYLPDTTAVVVAFAVASLGAHLPKEIRHRLLF